MIYLSLNFNKTQFNWDKLNQRNEINKLLQSFDQAKLYKLKCISLKYHIILITNPPFLKFL